VLNRQLNRGLVDGNHNVLLKPREKVKRGKETLQRIMWDQAPDYHQLPTKERMESVVKPETTKRRIVEKKRKGG